MSLNETISYYSQTVDLYAPDIFKVSLHLMNYYSNNWGSLLLVILIGLLSLWSMREGQQETMKAITVSFVIMFIISFLLFAYGEFVDVHMYIIGTLTGILLIFQKGTKN